MTTGVTTSSQSTNPGKHPCRLIMTSVLLITTFVLPHPGGIQTYLSPATQLTPFTYLFKSSYFLCVSMVSNASVGCTTTACLSGPRDVGHQSCFFESSHHLEKQNLVTASYGIAVRRTRASLIPTSTGQRSR